MSSKKGARPSAVLRCSTFEEFERTYRAQLAHDQHIAGQKLDIARRLLAERRRLEMRLLVVNKEIQAMALTDAEFLQVENKRDDLSEVAQASDRSSFDTLERGGRS